VVYLLDGASQVINYFSFSEKILTLQRMNVGENNNENNYFTI